MDTGGDVVCLLILEVLSFSSSNPPLFSPQEFTNCTCLGVGNWTESTLQVTPGQCPIDCGAVLPIFLVGYFITMFFNFMPGIPATNTCLRYVLLKI